MCGNRVEELESRVKELEASVEGLTDELVECKVRVRELESAVDEELDLSPEHEFQGTSGTATEPEAEPGADSTKAEPADREAEENEEADSDIIIA
jgi:uncharacterized coiled-coil protein SlyX